MINIPLTFEAQFEIPKGLSKRGLKTAKVIKSFAKEWKLDTGGCKTFYSPKEWKKRGEQFGENSELIVVYDGGDLAQFFNYDYENYGTIRRMEKVLSETNVYSEGLYCWCSGIYNCDQFYLKGQ